jgi:hypothetical protein
VIDTFLQFDSGGNPDGLSLPFRPLPDLSRTSPARGLRPSMVGMKHILFADKTILLGDDAADALVAYLPVEG